MTATRTKIDYIVVFPALDDKTKADLIIDYVEDLDFGEPIFVPKRQETHYDDGMYYRSYMYYGLIEKLGDFQQRIPRD